MHLKQKAVSSILDSLEDMQYLTDYFDSEYNFIDELFEDVHLHDLLEVKRIFSPQLL